MSSNFSLKKGLDIKLKGVAEKALAGDVASDLYGIRPSDFPGLTPKLAVKAGDRVKAGTTLFTDKARPSVRFASPVSGTVKDIVRGEQRRILEIIVERSGEEFEDFGKTDTTAGREELISKLLEAGLWPMIRQRPYHIVANPLTEPKAIFISGFDSAPLAANLSFVSEFFNKELFAKGLSVLKNLTSGKVHLVLNAKEKQPAILSEAKGVEISYFSGPHPAGNTGVHIHHIDPVNKGEVVWYVNLQDIEVIGRLFAEGRYLNEKVIALAGSEVNKTGYYRVRSGISVKDLVSGRTGANNQRIISGNVLSGTAVQQNGFLGFYDNSITVIPEGDYFEFFGWMSPGLNKFSFSKTFLSSVLKKKEYVLDTNMHGGHRAFVMTGQYEKVVPMDIYPMQLLKAIIAEDIDTMENLGIYEIAPEDFALCEFICPSKTEIQSIVRQGLDLMVKEMS